MNKIGDVIQNTILDYVFNSIVLKFENRERYNETIYSDLHKEFITTLVSMYLVNTEDTVISSENTNLIEFSGLGVESFGAGAGGEYRYDEIETLALHLSLQVKILEKRGFTMLYLQSEDIIRIRINCNGNGNGNEIKRGGNFYIYLLADLNQMVPLDKQNYNIFVLNYPKVYPFPNNVCAPELHNISMLPFTTHRSAIYYSVGLLCLHLLKRQNLSLNNLRDTPLFYFLERCLKEEPLDRMCLFI